MTRPEPAPNGPPAGELSPKQEQAAFAVARGLTNGEVAKQAGAGERTVKTWKALPAFRQRVAEIRAEMTERALGRLTDGLDFAVTALRKMLTAKSEQSRMSAIRTLFDVTLKLKEQTELEDRMAALEQQAREAQATRGRVSR
jgi:hypothetical protein